MLGLGYRRAGIALRRSSACGAIIAVAAPLTALHCTSGPPSPATVERVAQTVQASTTGATSRPSQPSQPTSQVTYSQVSGGYYHTCALRANPGKVDDKRVDCWGSNDFGESLPPLDQFQQISANEGRTCGVRVDGSLVCWGHGGQGNVPTGTGYTYVGAGGFHGCALKADGTAACWLADVPLPPGYDYGQGTAPAGIRFSAISVGAFYNCGLVTDGTLKCWGIYTKPNEAYYPPGGTYKALSAGPFGFACAQKADNTLSCWGDLSSGRGSVPTQPFASFSMSANVGCGLTSSGTPVCWGDDSTANISNIPPNTTFSSIPSGVNSMCGVRTNGTIACWGVGARGATVAPGPANVIAVRSSTHHACALEADGTPYCWGSPAEGATYDPKFDVFRGYAAGSDRTRTLPSSMLPAGKSVPLNQPFADIQTGLAHTCALGVDGSISCWGDNSYGQSTPPSGVAYAQIATGAYHTCGLRANGTLDCWGVNDAPFPPRFTPPNYHCYSYLPLCASASASCPWFDCGGDGIGPYLYNAGTNPTSGGGYPAGQLNVPATTTFKAVTTGLFNTCGQLADGTWRCWGDGIETNGNNLCYDNNKINTARWRSCNWYGESTVPSAAGPLTAVSSRLVFSAGLQADGTPVFWGTNDVGQFNPPTGTKLAQISAGGNHACGVTPGGSALCWGANDSNQTLVPPGLNWAQVSAGENHTCGVTSDGDTRCWGANDAQQVQIPPGAFRGLAASTSAEVSDYRNYKHDLCVIRKNGYPYCGFGSTPYIPSPAATITKPFRAFGMGDTYQCGLHPDGTIDCYGTGAGAAVPALTRSDPYNPAQTINVQGTYFALSVGPNHVCALSANAITTSTPNGQLYCWGSLGGSTPLAQALTSIASTATTVCGVQLDGTIACFGNQLALPPAGTFTRVRAGYNNTCAIRVDGTVACWGDSSGGANTPPAGTFKDLAVGFNHACGLRADSSVACWGTPPESPAGKFVSIAAGRGFTCGERADRSLSCWGNHVLGTRDGIGINQKAVSLTACQPTVITLTADSGTPPFTYAVLDNGGQLPPGLRGLLLSPDGVLSGSIPQATSGTYAVNLAVTDAYGYRGLGTLQITVAAGLPNSMVVNGGSSPQAAATGAAFAKPLSLTASDCAGNRLSGLTVNFLASSNVGATAILSAQSAQTDANGVASVSATAGSEAGGYIVSATIAGIGAPAIFQLSNVKAIRTACSNASECATGFCADGYCCDAACTGSCMSCDGAFNTKGTGTCSPVQSGIDPRNQCGKASCAGDSVVSSACDGAGACRPASQSCTPYTCDAKIKSCKNRCLNDSDCVTSGQCDLARGQCVAGVVTGKCKDATTLEQASGANVDCAPFLCVHGACSTICNTSDDCATGYDCHGQKCQPHVDSDAGPDQAVTINAKRGCAVGPADGAGDDGLTWGALGALGISLFGARRRARARKAAGSDQGARR